MVVLNQVALLRQEVVVQVGVVDTIKEQQEVEIHLQQLHLKVIMVVVVKMVHHTEVVVVEVLVQVVLQGREVLMVVVEQPIQ